jgi:hypothetical protein
MKKIGIILLIMFMMTSLFACQDKELHINLEDPEGLNQTNPDDPKDQHTTPPSPLEDSVYFRRFDKELFIYAEVYIYGLYDDLPDLKTTSLDNLRAYYQRKAQTFIDDRKLETEGHASKIFISNLSTLIHLTYTDKQSFFLDFDILKALHQESLATLSIYLNTVGLHVEMTSQLSYQQLLEQSNLYQGYSFIQPSLSFQVLELRGNRMENHLFPLPKIVEHPGIIINNFETYLTYFPRNHYNLRSDYFDTKVILYAAGGRSGSVSILNVLSVYLYSDNHFEIAIETEQYSNLVTMDYIMYYVVVSIDRTDVLVDESSLSLYEYNHFLNGYLSEKPFDIRPRTEK